MGTNSHIRHRIAVKRSVHFVLTEDFANSVKGVAQVYTKEFWKYLDNKSSETRRDVREAAWKVWSNIGVNTLSCNFTQGTSLIVGKDTNSISLSLKETVGSLTLLQDASGQEPLGDDPRTPSNDEIFEKIWKKLIYQNASYPSEFRPVTSAVAQMISARTQTPLPVVCAGLKKKFNPSELSNGFQVMAKNSMPDEVFEQSLVDAAIQDGIAEMVGQSNNFTFKVKKNHYREWIARVEATTWDPSADKSKHIVDNDEEAI